MKVTVINKRMALYTLWQYFHLFIVMATENTIDISAFVPIDFIVCKNHVNVQS
jgi:hypothetical protein